MDATLDTSEMHARLYRWTVEDYVELTEEKPAFRRYELIRGLIVEKMSKTPLHLFLTTGIHDFFLRCVRAGMFVRLEGPLQMSGSMPEPDVAIISGARQDFRTSHPTTAELVIEVAVSSVAWDRKNASLYAEAGVVEYWIVLGETEEIETYRRPENGVYQERRTYRRGETIPCACVEGGGITVEDWFS